jgi:small subunit ribosomal protein S19
MNILNNKNRSIIRTKSRSSTILQSFIGLIFEVYTGKSYTKIYIDEKMVGHKLGEFSFTRKLGKIHEKKKNRKKIRK